MTNPVFETHRAADAILTSEADWPSKSRFVWHPVQLLPIISLGINENTYKTLSNM